MNDNRPHALRVDHLDAPLGLGAEPPRLSWKLPPGASHQAAFRVVAGNWDSGRVESAGHLFVDTGVEPESRATVEWKVKTWTDLGESEWSEPSRWEYGLLGESDWRSQWVSPVEDAGGPARQRPAYQLATGFQIDGEVVRARLYATAHGIYEAFVNGERVGDLELTPGWTAYRDRLQVQAYDVTDLVASGPNVVGAILSDGWWRGQNSVARRCDDYGKTTALLLQLEVTSESGEVTVATDSTWRAAPGHIVRADLIAGEVHDLRRRAPWREWSDWPAVQVEDHGFGELCATPAPPVRRIEELRPVSVRGAGGRRWVVDVGQNINGWVRLGRLGPAGTEITLTYGEWLDQDGFVTQEHIAHQPGEAERSVPFQVDRVTSAGTEGETFEPRHSTKGFQFVGVDGYEGELTEDDITAIVVHTDFDRRGAFACSDERIDAIHRLADWSFRGNACDIPTDCPTRERAGWTGDWQIYVETASFLHDVGGFSIKWLRDLAADQRPDGKVTSLVPESHPFDWNLPSSSWLNMEGASGWGDAAVHVPWVVYRTTGDEKVLDQQWDSMRAYVDYAAGAAAAKRHPSRVERSADPAPHEQYIWDTGWHFGEWLEAGQSLTDAALVAIHGDHGPVATAYLHRSAQELSDIARILGRDAEAARYAELAASVADAWRVEFLTADGRATPDTQATYARALTFGLIPDELRDAAARRLVELVRAAGNHVGTGFLATPFLLPALAETGHLDVAFDLLLQDSEPSWLVMVDRGATTVWEEWVGVDSDGRPHASLNHYSKGAVISFLHQYVAGLQLLEPGYRRFRIAPHPGGGITWATAHHDSPYGRIEVRWAEEAAGIGLDVTVPPGTTAEVLLPSADLQVLSVGTHHISG